MSPFDIPESMNESNQTPAAAQFESPQEAPLDVAAWQEVEPGRFMPRRVRGSCVGRALG
jgi:hypothetical protein